MKSVNPDRVRNSEKTTKGEKTMRMAFPLSLLALFFMLTGGVSLAQEVDLSGTWEGTTEVPDLMAFDRVTLILERNEEGYAGRVTDSLGLVQDAEIEDVTFENSTLTFYFTVFTGQDYTAVHLTLTVEGDKMTGYWETDDGSSASIELIRIKR